MDKERFLAQKILALLEMFSALAVIGPWQCGKSTLVKAVCPDWKYYDLERPDDYELITSDPLGFFQGTGKTSSLMKHSNIPTCLGYCVGL